MGRGDSFARKTQVGGVLDGDESSGSWTRVHSDLDVPERPGYFWTASRSVPVLRLCGGTRILLSCLIFLLRLPNVWALGSLLGHLCMQAT